LAGSKQETLLTDLLLQLIVETGRSVFQNLNNPTLHLGPEKQGKLAWIKDNQDRSALRFAIDDCGANENIAVLSAVSPWYIDQNTWQAGPLRTASPIGLVKQVLKTPAFTQSQLTYVQVWLEENAPYSIPYPLPGVQTEVQIVKPIVSLRFETISGSAVSFRKGKSDLAIVEVEYPGLPFNEEGEGIDMVTRVGNKIVVQKPDIAAFRKMIDEFEAWGFHKVDSENQLDHGTFLYSPDNRRSLQRFLSEATEDFRNRGWEIQIDKSFRHSISLDLSQLNVKVRNLDKWRFSLTLSSTTA
jgi:hypothetical protein